MSLLVDRAEDLREAIFEAQATGREVELGPGDFLFEQPIMSTARNGLPLRTTRIRGQGMRNTVLVPNDLDAFTYTGLFGYGGHDPYQPHIAPLHLSDVTIDGRYGAGFEQRAGHGLVSLPEPFGSAYDERGWRGPLHRFERVHFFRPPGYVFQPAKGVHLHGCEFERCGQPDLEYHLDNLGSGGWGFAIVEFCVWYDSSGNYVDFEGSGGKGKPVRLIFIGNRSSNHGLGGVYGMGVGSNICHNDLWNNEPGSGISYDSLTTERRRNIVKDNLLHNIGAPAVNNPWGDIVNHNQQL